MKTVAQSAVENNIIVQPNELNFHGTLFGGKLVSYIDEIAAIAAVRHAELPVVTIAMDEIIFEKPVFPENIVTLKASVNRVFRTSMEVGVFVSAYSPQTKTYFNVCKAYITFVAIDSNNTPIEIEQIVPQTALEKMHFKNAEIRRAHRIELREKLHTVE